MDSLALARLAVAAAADKKAEDILLIDLRGISEVADFFIICNGSVSRQIDAIADNIAQTLKRNDKSLQIKREGKAESGWILLDGGDFIAHIFTPSQRKFYNLENLWKKAPVLLRVQ